MRISPAALIAAAMAQGGSFARSLLGTFHAPIASDEDDKKRSPRPARRGWSVAEGKRRARKARNRLRAKGRHRRAVR